MGDIFTPLDITWIKNVTSHTGDHAYMNLEQEKFVLHFPTVHKSNAKTPLPGELILIQQKIDSVRVFSHLVSPIDNKLVETKARVNYRYGRKVAKVAATPLDKLIPVSSTLWSNIRFQGISQGNACRIKNISGIDKADPYLKSVWDALAPFFADRFKQSVAETNSYLNEIDSHDEDLSVEEGKMKLISHYRRERNREIVRRKKEQAFASGNHECEICGFSFKERFGVNFIECHHLNPISDTGQTETTLDDLALVCANCHRILHRKIDGKFPTIEQLQHLLEMPHNQ